MRKKKLFLLIIALLFVSCVTGGYISHFVLKTTEYCFENEASIKIAMISDLHGRKFGNENSKLIGSIKSTTPDIIIMCGDFIEAESDSQDIEDFLALCNNLLSISPVYFSLGNHELEYFAVNGDGILSEIEALGVTVLEEEYEDIVINGRNFRIGGIIDYAFNQTYTSDEIWQNDSTYLFLKDFESTDATKILLCHRPDSFIYGNARHLWDIDYILCGHTHGGIWQLPFIGGVFAPEQGFFPEYDKGVFEMGRSKMIISSGLSGHKNIPRLFNSPEITYIEL